jgi:actin
MKEKLGYVALDFDAEMQSGAQRESCLLPTGHVIELKNERFECTELLFNPQFIRSRFGGIHTLLQSSIIDSNVDEPKELYQNIVLSGGTTLLPGLPERLHNEMALLAPPQTNVRIVAPAERKHAVWIGGSILGSLAAFPERCVTRQEYNDNGPKFVHSKCK